MQLTRSYLQSILTSMIIGLGGVLIYKLAGYFFEQTTFLEYALFKRNLSLIHPTLLLGMGVALPREISLSTRGTDDQDNFNILLLIAALISVGVAYACVCVVFFIYSEDIALLLFGSRIAAKLAMPLILATGGLLLHSLCYSYFRGKMEMGMANFLEIINGFAIPLVTVLMFSNSLEILFYANAILHFAFSMVVCLVILNTPAAKASMMSFDIIFRSVLRLLRIGLGRLPGDFAYYFIVCLPPIACANITNAENGGGLALMLSLLGFSSLPFTAFSVIALPYSANRIRDNQPDLLMVEIGRVLKYCFLYACLVITIIQILSEWIVSLFLTPPYDNYSYMLRLISISLFPHVAYLSMRSIVDVIYLGARNARNCFISISLQILVDYLGYILAPSHTISIVILSYCFSMLVLTVLTYISLRKGLVLLKSSCNPSLK